MRYQSFDPSPELSSSDGVIEAGNFTEKGDRKIEIFADEELVSLAKKVAGAFERVPLLGILAFVMMNGLCYGPNDPMPMGEAASTKKTGIDLDNRIVVVSLFTRDDLHTPLRRR